MPSEIPRYWKQRISGIREVLWRREFGLKKTIRNITMNQEALEEAKIVLSLIAKSKNYSEVKDFNSLFLDAESIISSLAYLIGPLRDQEQEYRSLIVKFTDQGDSHAKAEAKAKASDEYKFFKKLEDVYELAKEQVMILKKFKGDLEAEYKRS